MYVFENQEVAEITDNVINLESNVNLGFTCRLQECGKHYKSDSWRVRYVHLGLVINKPFSDQRFLFTCLQLYRYVIIAFKI